MFWNFVVTFAFYNSHFIVLLDSAIRMSAFDSLVWVSWRMAVWSRDLTDETLILGALHHCTGIVNGKTEKNPASLKFVKSNSLVDMYKMSFGTRSTGTRQTIWRTTLNLRYLIENRNQAVLFDWVEFISVFPTAAGRIDFKRWVTDCVYIRREAQS